MNKKKLILIFCSLSIVILGIILFFAYKNYQATTAEKISKDESLKSNNDKPYDSFLLEVAAAKKLATRVALVSQTIEDYDSFLLNMNGLRNVLDDDLENYLFDETSLSGLKKTIESLGLKQSISILKVETLSDKNNVYVFKLVVLENQTYTKHNETKTIENAYVITVKKTKNGFVVTGLDQKDDLDGLEEEEI